MNRGRASASTVPSVSNFKLIAVIHGCLLAMVHSAHESKNGGDILCRRTASVALSSAFHSTSGGGNPRQPATFDKFRGTHASPDKGYHSSSHFVRVSQGSELGGRCCLKGATNYGPVESSWFEGL